MEVPMLQTLLSTVNKINLSEMGGFFFIIGIRH